jgi:hypothetical protein
LSLRLSGLFTHSNPFPLPALSLSIRLAHNDLMEEDFKDLRFAEIEESVLKKPLGQLGSHVKVVDCYHLVYNSGASACG